MSELKAYLCMQAREIENKTFSCYRQTLAVKNAPEASMAQVYLKSEADKVIAELETNLSEIQSQKMQLEDDVALLRRNNAELKEERRWRKFPEEKPEHNGIFIVLIGEHTRTLDAYDTNKGKFKTYRPTAWMPLPSAPKEEK